MKKDNLLKEFKKFELKNNETNQIHGGGKVGCTQFESEYSTCDSHGNTIGADGDWLDDNTGTDCEGNIQTAK